MLIYLALCCTLPLKSYSLQFTGLVLILCFSAIVSLNNSLRYVVTFIMLFDSVLTKINFIFIPYFSCHKRREDHSLLESSSSLLLVCGPGLGQQSHLQYSHTAAQPVQQHGCGNGGYVPLLSGKIQTVSVTNFP